MKPSIPLAVVAACWGNGLARSPASSFARGSSMQSWQKPGLKSVDLVARHIRAGPFGRIVGHSSNGRIRLLRRPDLGSNGRVARHPSQEGRASHFPVAPYLGLARARTIQP